MTKKKSLRDVKALQSKISEQPKISTSVSKKVKKVVSTKPNQVTGLDHGKRKSPRINITISRNTFNALHTEMELQKDKGLKGSMSAFVDQAIREKLKLDK